MHYSSARQKDEGFQNHHPAPKARAVRSQSSTYSLNLAIPRLVGTLGSSQAMRSAREHQRPKPFSTPDSRNIQDTTARGTCKGIQPQVLQSLLKEQQREMPGLRARGWGLTSTIPQPVQADAVSGPVSATLGMKQLNRCWVRSSHGWRGWSIFVLAAGLDSGSAPTHLLLPRAMWRMNLCPCHKLVLVFADTMEAFGSHPYKQLQSSRHVA